MSIQILEADASHLDLLVPLFDAYRVFYEKPSDLAGARAFLKARMAGQESVIYLAVDAQGQGMGFTQLYPLFSSVRMRRVWLLNDLYVDPQARRRGVGQALMNRAKQLGQETDAAEVALATAKDNHQAKALYEALGYALDSDFDYYALKV